MSDQDDVWRAIAELRMYINNNERKISALEAPALEERVRKLEIDSDEDVSRVRIHEQAQRIAALEARVIKLFAGDIETHNQRLNAMANTYVSMTERVMKIEEQIAAWIKMSRDALLRATNLEHRIMSVEAFNGRLNALENAEMDARDAIDWKGFRRLVARVEATAKQSDDLGGRLETLRESVDAIEREVHEPKKVNVTIDHVEVRDPDRFVAEMEKRLAEVPLSTDRPKPSETMPMWQRRVMDEIDSATAKSLEPPPMLYRGSSDGPPPPPPVMIGLDEFVPISSADITREEYDHAILKLEECQKEIKRLQHDNMQRKEALSNHKRDKAAQAARIGEQQREIECLKHEHHLAMRALNAHIGTLQDVIELEKLKTPLFDLARRFVQSWSGDVRGQPMSDESASIAAAMYDADEAYEKAMSSRADLADADIPF